LVLRLTDLLLALPGILLALTISPTVVAPTAFEPMFQPWEGRPRPDADSL